MTNFHFSPRPNRANEIHWHEWGPEAFAEAQQQDKPIVMDISAVWCHWCHVMDETTYSDPVVIQMMNERFIPVRVDNDQRPDVNRRYNLGGWPTTAFLTPGGEVLTGGTYIPPQQMRGYLYQVSEAYRQDKAGILQKVKEVAQQRAAHAARAGTGAITDEVFDNVARAVMDNFDTLYGGFGDEPKFFHPEALELALARYFISRDEDFLPVVTITLTKMARGGVYDQVAGGFFRYSTTRDWSVPHFEKMLEDNARLLSLYLHAYQVTGRQLFRDTARSMVGYINATLHSADQGYFYGSQDADEHYYALPKEERAKLPAPYVDQNLYTDWNALMISAYLEAARLLDDMSLQKTALYALGTLSDHMFEHGEGMFHFRKAGETAPQLPGQLSDQAYTALAFIDAYQATARPTYLSRARVLAEFAVDRLFDQANGGFFSEAPHPDAPGLLQVPDKALGENAAMADVLTQLYHLTGEERYRTAAERTLAFFVPDYERYSFTAAGYALAAHRFLHDPLHIAVIGSAEGDDARELLHAALKEYAPSRLVELVDPERDAARLSALGYPPSADGAQAYVCVGQMCLPPVTEPRQIAEGITRVRSQTTT